MTQHILRAAGLVLLVVAGLLLGAGVSEDADAGKRATHFSFGTTSTTRVPDVFCETEIKLYDPVELTSLALSGFDISYEHCSSPIVGVTVSNVFVSGGVLLENFPAGFRGPATLLICEFEVLHHECGVAIDDTNDGRYIQEARGAGGVAIEAPALCAASLDCERWPCSDPGPYYADACGDPNRDGSVTATDALVALLASVADGDCAAAQCDADRNGSVQATDALRILSASLQDPSVTELLRCPAPC